MEQDRKPADPSYITGVINKLVRYQKFSQEVLKLVRSDLEAGIPIEEIEVYLAGRKKLTFRQMKVYSETLRSECPEEVREFLFHKRMSDEQTETLWNLYQNHIPFEIMTEIFEKNGQQPHRMMECAKEYLHQAGKKKAELEEQKEKQKEEQSQQTFHEDEGTVAFGYADTVAEDVQETVKEAVVTEDASFMDEIVPALSEIRECMKKLESQREVICSLQKRADTLTELLSSEDDKVRQRLVDDIADREATINSQQNEINKAVTALSRVRKEKEELEEKLKKQSELLDEIDELKRQLKNKELDLKEAEERMERRGNTAPVSEVMQGGYAGENMQNTGYGTEPQLTPKAQENKAYGIPVYYQIPVTKDGRIIQHVEVEQTARKTGGGIGLLARLGFKKKSRADIVKLVASGELVPAQLVQIKNAIERGLTEGQLVELINNNVSAEKMKEIIEIAVLENSLA